MGVNLKSEEEVREYLKNLYTEYRFGCESEKRPEVCQLLGDYEEAIKRDFDKAAVIYKTNCDERNHARSCAKYGSYVVAGRGCKENFVEAYNYMKKGCELGDSFGCLHAGALGVSEKELPEKDRATQVSKGIEMLKKSCWEHGMEKGCYYLSGVYISGIKGYCEPNLREAYKVSLKACEAGNPYACANVSQMHARGEGAAVNPNLAETFKKRAIELHNELTETRRTLEFHQGIAK